MNAPRITPPKFEPRPRLFHRTPPAIFPPVLGLFGLGVAWRRGMDAFGIPPAPVEGYLGAVTLLFLFCIVAYGVKVMLRPGVVREDFHVLPGRAGLAAMSMCVMLLSVVMLPYAAGFAQVLLVLGLFLHAVIAVSALRVFLAGPDEARRVTPVMHLTFVGFIVAPLAALPLGMSALTNSILWYSAAAALLIWATGLRPLLAGTAPPPLRPLQAIHLAPAAFVATVAHLSGQTVLGNVFALWAVLLFVILVVRVRWLTAAGFSGFWSAFTFPLAAFAGMLFVVALSLGSEAVRTLAGLALVLATLAIPPIALKVIQLWARGTLAEKTNAARV